MKYVGWGTTIAVAAYIFILVVIYAFGGPDMKYAAKHPDIVRGVWKCYAEVTVAIWPTPWHRTLSTKMDDETLCSPKP